MIAENLEFQVTVSDDAIQEITYEFILSFCSNNTSVLRDITSYLILTSLRDSEWLCESFGFRTIVGSCIIPLASSVIDYTHSIFNNVTRNQKHHLEGNAIPAGYCHANAHYAGGVNNYLNSNHAKYLAQLCGRFFTFWKIFAANLRFLWRHLPMEMWKLQCFVKKVYCSNRWRKLRPNRSISDAIPPQTSTKLTKNGVLNLTLNCGAIWRRRQKPQYRCTTTITQVHKSPKDILENLLPVWLGGAQTCSFRAVFGLPVGILIFATALYSVLRIFFYISAHLRSRP